MRPSSFPVANTCMLMRILLLHHHATPHMCFACCSRTKEEYTIPFGACVWSTGVAMHPLLKQVLIHPVTCTTHTPLHDRQKASVMVGGSSLMLAVSGCSCSRACRRAHRRTSGPS